MGEAELLRLLVSRLLSGGDLPQCHAFAELLRDFSGVKKAIQSQLLKRFASVGRYGVDDDAVGDALGFLVVNLERGHSLAGSIWRSAAWVAEGRRFVTSRDYGPLLGCESVTHSVLTDGRYSRAALPVSQAGDDLDALPDASASEPWRECAIAEESERAKHRPPGSQVLGEWLADVYSSEFAALDWFGVDDKPINGADLLAMVNPIPA